MFISCETLTCKGLIWRFVTFGIIVSRVNCQGLASEIKMPLS